MKFDSTLKIQNHRNWVIPFGRPYYDETEIAAVANLLRTGDIATGRAVVEFEDMFASTFGFAHAVAVSSGSTANLLAIAALVEDGTLRKGDHVIVSGATFISAVSPVFQMELVPIFVDVAENGVNVDLDLVERAIEVHSAKAMLLPHTLGQSLDLCRLQRMVNDHGVALIEDCCESLGASHGGIRVGSAGRMATFSFYAGHHLTMGEGGVIGCDDSDTAELLRSLRSFGRDLQYQGERFAYPIGNRLIGREERYVHLRLGYNAKLTDMQAAFGLVQLSRHADLRAERRVVAGIIIDAIRKYGTWTVLGTPDALESVPFAIACLTPPHIPADVAARLLIKHSIEPRGFLGASLPDQPCFDRLNYQVQQPYKNAEILAARGLLIGCPPGLALDQARVAITSALAETV